MGVYPRCCGASGMHAEFDNKYNCCDFSQGRGRGPGQEALKIIKEGLGWDGGGGSRKGVFVHRGDLDEKSHETKGVATKPQSRGRYKIKASLPNNGGATKPKASLGVRPKHRPNTRPKTPHEVVVNRPWYFLLAGVF